jgi:hypothetical protein
LRSADLEGALLAESSAVTAVTMGGVSDGRQPMYLSADRYAAAGFAVVVQDIVLGAELHAMIAGIASRPLHVVVLAPAADEVAAREAGRAKTGYAAITPQDLDGALRNETPRIGLRLDTTALTVEETVAEILSRPAESLVS